MSYEISNLIPHFILTPLPYNSPPPHFVHKCICLQIGTIYPPDSFPSVLSPLPPKMYKLANIDDPYTPLPPPHIIYMLVNIGAFIHRSSISTDHPVSPPPLPRSKSLHIAANQFKIYMLVNSCPLYISPSLPPILFPLRPPRES